MEWVKIGEIHRTGECIKMARKRSVNSEIVISSGPATAAPARRVPSRRTRPANPVSVSVDSQPESPAYEPTHQEIAAQAYIYWEKRGCQGGSPVEDWARAERELRARASVLVA
jgi:hypothetical protein